MTEYCVCGHPIELHQVHGSRSTACVCTGCTCAEYREQSFAAKRAEEMMRRHREELFADVWFTMQDRKRYAGGKYDSQRLAETLRRCDEMDEALRFRNMYPVCYLAGCVGMSLGYFTSALLLSGGCW